MWADYYWTWMLDTFSSLSWFPWGATHPRGPQKHVTFSFRSSANDLIQIWDGIWKTVCEDVRGTAVASRQSDASCVGSSVHWPSSGTLRPSNTLRAQQRLNWCQTWGGSELVYSWVCREPESRLTVSSVSEILLAEFIRTNLSKHFIATKFVSPNRVQKPSHAVLVMDFHVKQTDVTLAFKTVPNYQGSCHLVQEIVR